MPKCASLPQDGELAREGVAPEAQAQEVDAVRDRSAVLVAQVPRSAESSGARHTPLQGPQAAAGEVEHRELERLPRAVRRDAVGQARRGTRGIGSRALELER